MIYHHDHRRRVHRHHFISSPTYEYQHYYIMMAVGDYLKSFYKKLPSEASYFNALFKVEGVERTDATCELVELEIIE